MSELRACTYGLTEIQPWATAILTLGKWIENRSWAPPKRILGTRIAVHAGVKVDKAVRSDLERYYGEIEAPTGVILGSVEVFGYLIRRSDGYLDAVGDVSETQRLAAISSVWRNPEARCQWLLRDPRTLSQPLPRKGALGLWSLTAVEVGHA